MTQGGLRIERAGTAGVWPRIVGRFRGEVFVEIHRGSMTSAEFCALCADYGPQWEITVWQATPNRKSKGRLLTV